MRMDWLQEARARHCVDTHEADHGPSRPTATGWWTSATLGLVVALALAVAWVLVVASPPHALGGATPPHHDTSVREAGVQTFEPGSSWLGEINRYRLAAGLNAVTDNASWDTGIANHLPYMANTPAAYRTGPYQSLHTENPASPYYTPDGAQEAARSDLFEGATGYNATQFIDGWLAAPFHAVGMLRPALQQVAFGDSSAGDAGLDVIGGLTGSPAAGGPALFPGPGMVTDLTSYPGNEEPDPLETCGWSGAGDIGLPLIALLTSAPQNGLTASLSGPGGTESTANGTLCVVDQNTYVSSDPVYGPTGQSILAGDHAVFLIPRQRLVDGTYSVTINQPMAPVVSWSFGVAQGVVGMAATPDGMGYWLTDANGDVSSYGDAQPYGSMTGTTLNAPISHIVSTSDGKGYWLVAADGGIFAFGDAQFFGAMGGRTLNQPVVGMGLDAATGGYWLVASDGGIFAFGAPFYGSTGNLRLVQPVNGMTTAPGGKGYWFVAADGGIFAFGGAQFYGSMSGRPLDSAVVGMATDAATGGYWLVSADGGVFGFNSPSAMPHNQVTVALAGAE